MGSNSEYLHYSMCGIVLPISEIGELWAPRHHRLSDGTLWYVSVGFEGMGYQSQTTRRVCAFDKSGYRWVCCARSVLLSY